MNTPPVYASNSGVTQMEPEIGPLRASGGRVRVRRGDGVLARRRLGGGGGRVRPARADGRGGGGGRRAAGAAHHPMEPARPFVATACLLWWCGRVSAAASGVALRRVATLRRDLTQTLAPNPKPQRMAKGADFGKKTKPPLVNKAHKARQKEPSKKHSTGIPRDGAYRPIEIR